MLQRAVWQVRHTSALRLLSFLGPQLGLQEEVHHAGDSQLRCGYHQPTGLSAAHITQDVEPCFQGISYIGINSFHCSISQWLQNGSIRWSHLHPVIKSTSFVPNRKWKRSSTTAISWWSWRNMVMKDSSVLSPEPGPCLNLTANMWTAAQSSINQRSESTISRLQAFRLVVWTTVLACCICMCRPDLTVSVE